MSCKISGVEGRQIIQQLLELAGKEYSKLVTGVTVTADMHNVVTVEVRMLAEDPNAD